MPEEARDCELKPIACSKCENTACSSSVADRLFVPVPSPQPHKVGEAGKVPRTPNRGIAAESKCQVPSFRPDALP